LLRLPDRSLSENSVVGPRASGFSPGKDGEAGDVCFIVDTAGCRQAEDKPLEARSNSPTGSQGFLPRPVSHPCNTLAACGKRVGSRLRGSPLVPLKRREGLVHGW
jgi:hypothetical protein